MSHASARGPAPGGTSPRAPRRVPRPASAAENLRGSALMIVAMFGFAVTDMFIKLLGAALPTGQILMVLGAGGAFVFATLALQRGDDLFGRAFVHPAVLGRNGFEIVGTLFFVSAIVHAPLSVTSAILQANPLIVTLGAALWLKEPVGLRRWSAIGIGLVGVLLVIQPWNERFEPASLLAVGGVFGLAFRDLATRGVPDGISSAVLSSYALAMLVPAGALLLLLPGASAPALPGSGDALLLLGAIGISTLGYYGITAAMRTGDVGTVTPFRYSRIVFALVIAALVFDETIDALMLGGAAIVVGSGLYTLWRERRLRAVSAATEGSRRDTGEEPARRDQGAGA